MAPSRIFLFSLLSFIFGVAVQSFFHVSFYIIFALGLASGSGFVFSLRAHSKKYFIFSLAVFSCGLGIFRYQEVITKSPDLSSYYGENITLSGVVAAEPERIGSNQRIVFFVDEADGSASFNVYVTLRSYPQYEMGDKLEVQGRMDDPHESRISGYADRLAREQIFALMYFPRIQKTGEKQADVITLALSRLKHAFEERIDFILPEPHAAFLKGLLLGERQDLPQALRENFAITGTTHIVALSGYNITLVGGLFMSVFLFFTVPFAVSFWLASAAIILFVLLTGASPSVVRAGIMGILVLLAQKEGRMYHMGNALAFAAAVMIWVNPRLLRFDAAFELSFLATFGLSYFSPFVERLFDKTGRYIKKITAYRNKNVLPIQKIPPEKELFSFKRIFIETLSAQLAVTPLLIYLFGRISLVSPFSNLLILIAVPYAMAIGFIATSVAFVSSVAGQVLGWGAWILLEYMIRIIELFSRVPFASISFEQYKAEVAGGVIIFAMLLVFARVRFLQAGVTYFKKKIIPYA